MPSIPSRPLAATGAAALLLLAACGSGGEADKSAQQILSDAKAALKTATSYHMAGHVSQDGQDIQIDVRVNVGTKSAMGHLGSGDTAFDFVETGNTLYLKGRRFLAAQAGDALASAVGDSWVKVDSGDQVQAATDKVKAFADPGQFADSIDSENKPVTKGGTSTVDGVSVVALTNSQDGTLYVATTGPAYPVRLSKGGSGQIDITEYGSGVSVSPPQNAIALSSLSGGSSSSSAETAGTKVVTDATKVRDGILDIGQGSITSTSGTADDAWGLAAELQKTLPSNIDVSVVNGDLSSADPATPERIVIGVTQSQSSGYLLVVAVDDQNGNCLAGALTGNPPNGSPLKASVASGQECTLTNALQALGNG